MCQTPAVTELLNASAKNLRRKKQNFNKNFPAQTLTMRSEVTISFFILLSLAVLRCVFLRTFQSFSLLMMCISQVELITGFRIFLPAATISTRSFMLITVSTLHFVICLRVISETVPLSYFCISLITWVNCRRCYQVVRQKVLAL